MTQGHSQWQNVANVVVVGLGMTGLSVVKYLVTHQPQLNVKVIDTRATPPGLDELPLNVEVHCGGWHEAWLDQADLVVINPGIALATPEIAHIVAKGTRVVGDIELFAWAVDKPVLAITGSNGKSTVTDLTGVMAKACGLNVGVGGNIGVPALDLLGQGADLYVLELSSFQLETTHSLPLTAAAFLNLSEDHQDRYIGMADYCAAKKRIFAHAKRAIVNRDDRETYPDHAMPLRTFGFDQQEFGTVSHQGEVWLARDAQPIIAERALKLVGKHNVANVLVALALLESAEIDITQALPALMQYTGLSHRCQVVADKRGIKWVNDSKATNIASTLAALSGLDCAGTLYLLVGGDSKGAEFAELNPVLAKLNVQLCCFGRDGDKFLDLHPSARRFDTMAEITAEIAPQLKAGDMVMLSPACASLDQFANFMARGDAFAALAQHYA